ncbi:MAG: hypothetical protein GY866_12310 [Proteobacteria bacterium]|nr:hypothetical protein [Pseudomonadota bacterium]
MFSWFQPNLFFLFPTIFCLHWKGAETYFISVLFGITADCFSTIPFGTFGLAFFLFSFAVRWYAIKIYQESVITLPIVTGFFTLICNLFVYLLLLVVFGEGQFTLGWFRSVVINEVLPTALLAVPSFLLLLKLERKYKIGLAERKI